MYTFFSFENNTVEQLWIYMFTFRPYSQSTWPKKLSYKCFPLPWSRGIHVGIVRGISRVESFNSPLFWQYYLSVSTTTQGMEPTSGKFLVVPQEKENMKHYKPPVKVQRRSILVPEAPFIPKLLESLILSEMAKTLRGIPCLKFWARNQTRKQNISKQT